MKYQYWVHITLILLLAGWKSVSAQCERNEYPVIIRLAKEDMADRNYQRCIERLLDARDICPDEKEEVNRLIRKAFAQVEGEKNRGDSLLVESEQRLHKILLNRLKDFQSGIYALEFDAAKTILKEASEFGVGKEETLEGYAELIFFYTEARKVGKAWGLYEEAKSLAPDMNDLSDIDTLAYLSGIIKQWVDSVEYERIYYRYYPRMVFVAGGEFTYQGKKDTTLSSFYIALTETTVWQYYLFVTEASIGMAQHSGWGYAGDNPVGQISWYDASNYAKWLALRMGHTYRLPGEVEWEFAARGGNQSQGFGYAGSDNIDEVAWYEKNAEWRTHPVGQKKPNELGLYDMSGNAYEWCQDPHPIKEDFDYRVTRGGSWKYNTDDCRSTHRYAWHPGAGGSDIGFRLVFSP